MVIMLRMEICFLLLMKYSHSVVMKIVKHLIMLYPRASDPASGKWLKAFNVGSNSFDINVGNFFGEGAISNTTTHVCTNVAANAVWKANDFVMFDENAITFQCTKDQGATNHSYPRKTDPTFGKWLPISNVNNTSFTVYVGKSGVNDIYNHTFVSCENESLHRQTGCCYIRCW